MTGQINMDSGFGKAIYQIASNPKYSTFCEVGTWNGLGSTVCLYEGIRNRNAHLYSIEAYKPMYDQAIQHWKDKSNITLLYGTLHRSILPREFIQNHKAFMIVAEHYRLYYEEEKACVETAPLVQVPPCEVLLLDGGEFTSEGDWGVLFGSHVKVVMLDDTYAIKTSTAYRYLLSNILWECVYIEKFENHRLGSAIFVRK